MDAIKRVSGVSKSERKTDVILPALEWEPSPWVSVYSSTPYVEKGRSTSGVDCWGLVWLIYWEQLGIDVGHHDDLEYEGSKVNKQEIVERVRSTAEAEWGRVSGNAQMFDVILFKIGSFTTHVGVVCSMRSFVHILQNTNVTIEDFSSPSWAKRIDSVWRHRKAFNFPVAGRKLHVAGTGAATP